MAVELWARYPLEIEADLSRYHHRRIADWHRGRMSSREFLTLVVYLPDESEYQTARRDGDWTLHQHIQKVIANELMNLRAGYHVVHGAEAYEPMLFESPAEFDMKHEDDKVLDELRDEVTSQLQRW